MLIIVLLLIWVIAGGFITQSSVFLTPYKDQDKDFNAAYWYAFWAAFVTWFLIGLSIILIIVSLFGFAEILEASRLASGGGSGGSGWTIFFLIISLILVTVTGVLSALTASSIIKSSNYDTKNSKQVTARTDAIIAASLSLGAVGLLILTFVVYIINAKANEMRLKEKAFFLKKEEQYQEREKKLKTEIKKERAYIATRIIKQPEPSSP